MENYPSMTKINKFFFQLNAYGKVKNNKLGFETTTTTTILFSVPSLQYIIYKLQGKKNTKILVLS